MPPGPFGHEGQHGNIVVAASADYVHVFRTVAEPYSGQFVAGGQQYSTRPVDRLERAAMQENVFDPAVGGTLEGSGLVLTVPAGVLAAAPGSSLTVEANVIDPEERAELTDAADLPEGVTPIGRAFDFSATLTENGQPGDPNIFDEPILLTVELTPDELAATDPEKVGLFRVNRDATMVFAGGRFVDGKLVAELWSFSLYVLAEANITFADLVGHWSRADVELMASKYVVKGLPEGGFDPSGLVTRAQFACMLVRAMGVKPVGAAGEGSVTFSDVSPSDWFYGELMAAVGTGTIKGYDDGTFRPNAPVTREQVAAMVARALVIGGGAAGLEPSQVAGVLAPFSDTESVSSWAVTELALALSEGIVTGQTSTTLAPQGEATRAMAATMIARYWRKD
jgi:hypothetical protein